MFLVLLLQPRQYNGHTQSNSGDTELGHRTIATDFPMLTTVLRVLWKHDHKSVLLSALRVKTVDFTGFFRFSRLG